jgi:hypothetical protein
MNWCDGEGVPSGEKKKDGTEMMFDAAEFYRFVRIGEEMDDNEVQGWGFDIHIQRSATY